MNLPRMTGRSLALAMVVAAAAPAHAAFEDVEVCPRMRAMGGAWSAAAGDVFAPFHNPAGLAWAARPEAAASYLRPFGYDFSSQSAVAARSALPGRLGGIALGVRQFGVSYRGTRLTSETTVALAHGFHLLEDVQSELAVGWGVNLYALDYGRSITGLDPGQATTFGLNLGATAVVRDRTRVGFQVTNLNSPEIGSRDKEVLRRRVSAGVEYSPYPGVRTVLDVNNELGQDVQYRGGAEFEVADFLRLRAGLRSQPSVLSAGFGVRVAGVSLDYGFSTGGGVLGETHHVGLGYALPGPR